MIVSIFDAPVQTLIFATIFLIGLILSLRKVTDQSLFPLSLTEELKGFAILAIILAHIGYYLVSDHRFLFPMSILAGMGVNLFLFLSGFGLSVSAMKQLSLKIFYKKRVLNLFLPLWLALIVLLLLDKVLLNLNFSATEIWQSFVGFYPKADLYQNLDSPLWFLTLIIFYYLIFPLVWVKKMPIISALIILVLSFWLTNLKLPVSEGVLGLYQVHFWAFPLGIAFAQIINLEVFKLNFEKIRETKIWRYVLMAILLMVFLYTAFHSGVGQGKALEQRISLVTMFSVIFIFILKPFKFKLFSLFGAYSYEIYLIHWPLIYHYGLLYSLLPASIATATYLIIFLGFGYFMQKLVAAITKYR